MAEAEEKEAPELNPAEQHHESIKDDIRAAFDKFAEEAEPAEAKAETPEPTEKVDGRLTRERDEKGRYRPKEETLEPPKDRKRQTAPAELEAPEPKLKAVPEPAKPVDAVDRLPASFKPTMLEAWKALPREAREEIHRRETEHSALIAQTKTARDFIGAIQQAVAPYQALLQAEGGSVPTALSNYLQAATLMRSGTPQAKAQWIAKLTKTFTTQEHLGLLDQALAAEFGINGAQPPQEGQAQPYSAQPQEFRDPRLDQLLAEREQERMASLEMGLQEARTEKDAWIAQANPEFLPWVQHRMATLLETAARDNEEMGFDEAYEAACRTHPEVRKILKQREEAARAQPAAVERSRRASVSLRPQGAVAPPSNSEGNSRRQDIEEAWESIMGR